MLGLSRVTLWIFMAALALVGLGSGWAAFKYTSAKYEAQIAKQKQEAAVALASTTKAVLTYERQVATLKDNIEVTHANNQKSIDSVMADNRRLIATAGGLRDPGRRSNSGCTVPTTASTSAVIKTTSDSPRLSNEAEEFLLTFAADADRVVEQYESCQRWVNAVDSNRYVYNGDTEDRLKIEGEPAVIKQVYLSGDRKSYDQLAAHSDFYLTAHISP